MKASINNYGYTEQQYKRFRSSAWKMLISFGLERDILHHRCLVRTFTGSYSFGKKNEDKKALKIKNRPEQSGLFFI